MHQLPLPSEFAPPPRHERTTPAARTLLAVAMLSAVLGSGLTFGMASALGALPPVAVAPAPTAAPTAADAQPAATTEEPADLVAVIASARESVVTITARGAAARDPFSPFNVPATGVGSGIVVSSNGLILTNYHVVEGARTLSVATAHGQTLDATVISTDAAHDMAVIRATGGELRAAVLGDSDQLQVGQTVLAIGSPLGEFTETVTKGIVSALGRAITVGDQATGASLNLSGLIQTDAAINPGNSGGPLVDMDGDVVGINSSIRTSGDSAGQGGSIGLGFAIPIDEVLPVIEQMIAGETPTHARLGITVSDVEQQAGELPLEGAQVQEVSNGSTADDAGLEQGDVITQLDSTHITSADSLVATIRSYRPGDQVTVTYRRGDSEEHTTLVLDSDAS
jgi:putative serine protease PepD